MTKNAVPSQPKSLRKRASSFTTATVVSFSLTLFAGGVAVLSGAFPLRMLTTVERIDIGTVLFVAPIMALILAVMVEATRIGLSRQPLPEPRRQQVIRNWSPGRREG
jgi:TRAP-type C4-dicarboxylate transport system permease small subunit